jgi:hypothetical protein
VFDLDFLLKYSLSSSLIGGKNIDSPTALINYSQMIKNYAQRGDAPNSI